MNRLELSQAIYYFLSEYAKSKDGQYNSPDAYCLESTARSLEDKSIHISNIKYPHSDYYQGGYKVSDKGFKEHEFLLNELINLQKKKTQCISCKKEITQVKFCPYCGSQQN